MIPVSIDRGQEDLMNSDVPRPGEDPNRPLDHRAQDRSRQSRVEQTEINERRDRPQRVDTDDSRVREPGMGPGDPIRFDGDRNVPPREEESVAPGPTIATGMFLPVVILAIVAIVLILVFLL
jgi:hypothetical protein